MHYFIVCCPLVFPFGAGFVGEYVSAVCRSVSYPRIGARLSSCSNEEKHTVPSHRCGGTETTGASGIKVCDHCGSGGGASRLPRLVAMNAVIRAEKQFVSNRCGHAIKAIRTSRVDVPDHRGSGGCAVGPVKLLTRRGIGGNKEKIIWR